MASKRVKDGPHWVKAWISELSALTDQFRDIETGAVDFEALGREEYHFRMALSRRDFTNSERARKVWEDAVGNYQQRIKAASKDKNPQDAPNGNAGVDRKSSTSCDQFTADGDTREGSLDEKSGTSADNCGPRQAKNGGLTRQGQATAKTRDSHGSGRYQPPSLGPEDGNLHDQETASGNYQVPDKVSTKPAGGHLKRSSSRSPVGDVLSLAYSGEFGNVRLTQEQYAELGIRFGNQQKLNRAIDSLSCLIENGEKNPQNHYAELVKWANYREDMYERKEEEASKPKMTEMEKSWIEAMKRVEAM